MSFSIIKSKDEKKTKKPINISQKKPQENSCGFSRGMSNKKSLTLKERWKRAEIPLSDIYKTLIFSVSFCVLIVLVLLVSGVRYKTAETTDGVKISFFGIVRDGAPHSGFLHFSDSTKAKISGNHNTVTYSDGTVFKGKLQGLMPDGEGTLQTSLGTYTGSFKNGLLEGMGECYYSNGAYYNGEFLGGIPHGNGKILFADGSNYSGQFENGEMQGVGIFVYTNGDYYDGEFYRSMRHGSGLYRWANGDSYQGEFAYSNITGDGTYTYK